MSHDSISERQLAFPWQELKALAARDQGAVSMTIECNDRRPPPELRYKPPDSPHREWWLKQTDLYCPACSVKYGVYVDAGFERGSGLGWDYVCVNCNKWWIMAIEPLPPSGHAKDMIRVLKENSILIIAGNAEEAYLSVSRDGKEE